MLKIHRKIFVISLFSIFSFYSLSSIAQIKVTPEEVERMGTNLLAIHATNFFPLKGRISVVDPLFRKEVNFFRPTTHFSLNQLVRAHKGGSWESKIFAIITPLADLYPQLISLNFHDSFILGHFDLTPHSHLLIPECLMDSYKKEIIKLRERGIQIHFYNLQSTKLRPEIEKIVKKMKGLEIDVSLQDSKVNKIFSNLEEYGEVFSRGININTKKYFEPLLDFYPQLTFGFPTVSIVGQANCVKIIDLGLTSLKLGLNSNFDFYENPRLSFAMIKYCFNHLDKLLPLYVLNHENAKDALNTNKKSYLKKIGELENLLKYLKDKHSNNNIENDKNIGKIARYFDLPRLIEFFKEFPDEYFAIKDLNTFYKNYLFQRKYILGANESLIEKEGLTNDIPLSLSSLDNQLVSNRPDQYGNFPIVNLIFKTPNEVKALAWLANGAIIDKVRPNVIGYVGQSLLSFALLHNMPKLADAIVARENYSDWDLVDPYGNSALTAAVVTKNAPMVLKLIQKGANTKIMARYKNENNGHPISLIDFMDNKLSDHPLYSEILKAMDLLSPCLDNTNQNNVPSQEIFYLHDKVKILSKDREGKITKVYSPEIYEVEYPKKYFSRQSHTKRFLARDLIKK